MSFFNVIIPTFNSAKTIERAVDSVERQTFKDYSLIIVDDCSEDNTREILDRLAKKYSNITLMYPNQKLYSGGTRNLAVYRSDPCEYLLFLDSDDEFINNHIFQNIYDVILRNNRPDMVRLPYQRYYDESKTHHFNNRLMDEERNTNIAVVAQSVRVACWTKAVRRELFRPFPENTLFEDVVQHLAQCDVVHSVVWLTVPCVRWHIHSSSTSHNNSPKWQSSAWRFIADLMDLDLKHDYCDSRRKKKIEGTKQGLLEGKAVQ